MDAVTNGHSARGHAASRLVRWTERGHGWRTGTGIHRRWPAQASVACQRDVEGRFPRFASPKKYRARGARGAHVRSVHHIAGHSHAREQARARTRTHIRSWMRGGGQHKLSAAVPGPALLPHTVIRFFTMLRRSRTVLAPARSTPSAGTAASRSSGSGRTPVTSVPITELLPRKHCGNAGAMLRSSPRRLVRLGRSRTWDQPEAERVLRDDPIRRL